MEKPLILIWASICLSLLAGFAIPNPITGLQKGDDVPDFTSRTITGKEITLSEQVKTGNVVILFYQGFWCTGCHKQLSTFREDLMKISAKGGHTIAITPTPLTGIPKRVAKSNKDVSIIIDRDLSLMRGFGILDDTPSEYVRGNKRLGHADFSFIPATYIIDEHMKVKFAHVDAGFTINAFVDSLLVHP